MNFSDYRKFLLAAIPTASSASGGKVISCRCFYCPDSKDPKSKHFYISIPQSESEPSLYYCHKCHASGLVTYKKLIEWSIYNEQVAIDLVNHNNNCSVKNNNYKYFDQTVYRLNNYYIEDNELTRLKLNMINKRLGTNMDYLEISRLKLVLNLNDLLNQNNIKSLTRDPRIVEELNYNFMGFISIDNAFLNMRRLCPEGKVNKSIDKRYINYKIFDKFDTSERFYTIPTEVNLLDRVIKLHVAEGPFDILSIYKNVRREEKGIYTSVGGSNYIGVIMYFLSKFMIPNAEIHLYPDNDKYGSNSNMNRIYNILKPLGVDMYVHRNMFEGEKDFGVSPDRINESIIKINAM